MKLKKLISVTLTLLLAIALLAGCSANAPLNKGQAFDEGYVANRAPGDAADAVLNESVSKPSAGTSQTGAVQSQKLIKTVRMNAETEDLDALLSNIEQRITELNGYVEARQVYNGNANSSRSRYAELTVRIPAVSLNQFVNHVSDISNIVSSSEDTQDVTLSYVATESHIKALKTEETRLLELLAKAENMNDLLLIESRLTEVRSELEKYTSQLRLYDNLVDYATIHLNLQEVKRYTVVEEPKTVWERIGSGFMESLRDLGDFGVELFVFLIVALPYLVLIAAVAVGVILLIKHGKRKKKKAQQQEENPQ